jgi:PAS domain S-box-containing protein
MADSFDRGTEQREAQALLVASEARLRAVVDTAADGIVLADTHGDIVEVNRAAGQMFGYATGELLGRPLTTLMPERFHVAHRAGVQRFLTTGEARVIGRTVELAGLRRDGQEFPVELSLAACQTVQGTFLTGIIRDITWRRQADRERAQQRAQLEILNKELETFSYSVSHDLRVPLRSIDGFSQVLLEDCHDQLNDQGRDALRRICAAIQRMERLIDAMLTLSRVTRSELQHEVVDLSALAHAVAMDLRKQDPERIVECVIHPDLTAHGDSRLLRTVLENLLSNAWKATAGRPRGRIEFGVSDEHDRAFFVRDNGIGFDPAYADKLFSPLQTLHRRTEFPGTGIGLATVQRIVTKHGGTVSATGAPNEGAAFYFTL